MTLRELLAARNLKRKEVRELRGEARAIYAAARSQASGLTDEQNTQVDEIESKIDAANTAIDALDRDIDHARAEIEADRSASPVIAVAGDGREVRLQIGDATNREASWGWNSLGEFADGVRQARAGRIDDRFNNVPTQGPYAAPANWHQEQGASEGMMVPPAFRDEIWRVAFPDDDLLALVGPEPTNSNSVTITKDETTPWGATGVQAVWRKEAGQMTASKLAAETTHVELDELYAFVLATDELLADAPRLGRRLTFGAGEAIRNAVNGAIMNGNGVGKPKGWMKSGALVTVAKESGQAAQTIVPANIVNMFARALNPTRSVWLVNSDVFPQLALLNLGNNIIWTPPATGLAGAPGGTLLGRPIRMAVDCETLGTLGDIQFVDPTGYYATQRAGEGLRADTSIHLYFDYGLTAFRWRFRVGGTPFLSAPVQPKKGAASKSHFIALATRA